MGMCDIGNNTSLFSLLPSLLFSLHAGWFWSLEDLGGLKSITSFIFGIILLSYQRFPDLGGGNS